MLINNVLGDGIGYVQLVDILGSDQSITEAARVSYLGESKGEEADHKLLNYLWNHNHHSPFEMASIKVIIKCPLFIRSQIHRHRTFSYNEVSRRYTSEEIEFYFPKVWRRQANDNKQASEGFLDGSPSLTYKVKELVEFTESMYDWLLANNVAREQARMVLPQNLYTKFVMYGNLRNWLHFCELRSDSHAQWEIQQYSNAILHQIIKEKFPWTYEVYSESH